MASPLSWKPCTSSVLALLAYLSVSLGASVNLLQVHRAAPQKAKLYGKVLQDGAASGKHRIPQQLILTGKYDSVEQFPSDVRDNFDKILMNNPELQVLWFNDDDCRSYLEDHPELELAKAFHKERRGSYRGDICRTAVLASEGGFYQDLDVELKVPFHELVDNSTSFMSVYSESGGILNALFATEPKGSVVRKTLSELQRWYNDPLAKNGQWMGPETMARGMQDVADKQCPTVDFKGTRSTLQWTCGKDVFRMYEERKLKDCKWPNVDSPGCSVRRAGSFFEGVKFALFDPNATNYVIGWPRYENCMTFGCAIGGWDVNRA